LEYAALEAGIPLDEARGWLEKRLSGLTVGDDLYLRKEMRRALKKATKTLHQIAASGPDEVHQMSKMYYPNLKAAESLLKFAVAAQKLLKGGRQNKKDEGGGQKDLFDHARERGPWGVEGRGWGGLASFGLAPIHRADELPTHKLRCGSVNETKERVIF
jgi:hypothetical protein